MRKGTMMIDIDLPERLLRGLGGCLMEAASDGEFENRPEHLDASRSLRDLLLPPPMVPGVLDDLSLSPAPGVAGEWRLSLAPVAHDTAVASVRYIVERLRVGDFVDTELPIRLLLTVDEFESLCAAMGVDCQVPRSPDAARHKPLVGPKESAMEREIWQDGKNIIMRDPTSPYGGIAFSRKTVEYAVQYLEDEMMRWGVAPK
jgi:hypothetical protein